MARTWLRAALAAALVILGLAACGSDSQGGGSGSAKSITIWDGYTDTEAKVFAQLIAQYNKANPGVKVTSLFVNNDNSLQKVSTAVRGGSVPDIAYLYGSWAPNVAPIPQVVNLTQVVKRPGVNWNDFWVGERDVATVNGKVIGIPALVDNLAVVYNKTLFAKAHLALPSANWTWNDFVADAQKLTNASAKQFGTAYVTPGSEDTVWHWVALLWEAGGAAADPGQQEGGVQLGGRAEVAGDAAHDGCHRQVDVPGPDRLGLRQPVQLGQDRHGRDRPVGPVQLPQRALRRAGHARLPRCQRRAPDHLRAG